MWSRKYGECIVCGTIKRKHVGNGMCKNCYSKQWIKDNPEKYKKNYKKSYKKNKEAMKEASQKWYKKNPKKRKECSKRYYDNNLEKCKENNKKQYEKNKNKERFKKDAKERSKKYYKENSEKVKKQSKKWKENNIKKVNKQRRVIHKNKIKNDPHYKLKHHISGDICRRLKKRLLSKNDKSTWDFLPYTVDELKQHLENLFKPWMNWDNWGVGKNYWNIDHKKPDSLFNYKSVHDKEFQECWALSNLQPLDAIENIKKGNKFL